MVVVLVGLLVLHFFPLLFFCLLSFLLLSPFYHLMADNISATVVSMNTSVFWARITFIVTKLLSSLAIHHCHPSLPSPLSNQIDLVWIPKMGCMCQIQQYLSFRGSMGWNVASLVRGKPFRAKYGGRGPFLQPKLLSWNTKLWRAALSGETQIPFQNGHLAAVFPSASFTPWAGGTFLHSFLTWGCSSFPTSPHTSKWHFILQLAFNASVSSCSIKNVCTLILLTCILCYYLQTLTQATILSFLDKSSYTVPASIFEPL